MAFFFPDAEVQEDAAPRGRTVRAQRKIISQSQKGCDACPLQRDWPRLLTARMPIDNLQRSEVLVLGGIPEAEDDKAGVPFKSQLGKMVRDNMPSRDRGLISYGNVARCAGSPANVLQAGHACSTYLEEDIGRTPLQALLLVGNAAFQRFAPGTQIGDAYGLKFPVAIAGKTLWAYGVHDPEFVKKMGGKFEGSDGPGAAIFKASVKRFFQQYETWGTPRVVPMDPGEVLYPKRLEEAEEILDAMEGDLGIDLESSHLKPYIVGSRLLTGAISDGNLTMAFPIDHPEEQHEWALPFLLETARTRRWIAHNASMELVWMTWHANKIGASTKFMPFNDTMAQARLHFARAGCSDLGAVSQIVLGTNLKNLSQVQASRIMEYPLSEVLPYNGLDAQGSALIHKVLRPLVLNAPYLTMLDAVQCTAQMELLGLTLDPEQTALLRTEWQGKIDQALNDALGLYEVREFEMDVGRKFNIASPDVGEALVKYGKVKLPKTPKDKQYQTDDATLTRLCPDNPLARAVLDYRAANKLVSTYIDPLESALTINADGLLHPSYTVLLTRTGRLSSNDPNIQNFPKRKHKELRRQIRARFGHVFLALDYGQLEARIIAMASRDRAFCKAIIDGFDVHSAWLDECLKIHPDYLKHLAVETNLVGGDPKKIRKAGRDIIKTDFVFASFFGSGAPSISARTKIPQEKVTELHRVFWNTYADAKNWIKDRRYEYATLGTSRTLTGRERFDVLMGNEPLNNPIQGTGADIVVESMNGLALLSRQRNDPYLHPRINIHDDLIFELPDDEDRIAEYMDIILPEMVKVRHDFQIVPLMVEARIGENWADLTEFTTYTGAYNR